MATRFIQQSFSFDNGVTTDLSGAGQDSNHDNGTVGSATLGLVDWYVIGELYHFRKMLQSKF